MLGTHTNKKGVEGIIKLLWSHTWYDLVVWEGSVPHSMKTKRYGERQGSRKQQNSEMRPWAGHARHEILRPSVNDSGLTGLNSCR